MPAEISIISGHVLAALMWTFSRAFNSQRPAPSIRRTLLNSAGSSPAGSSVEDRQIADLTISIPRRKAVPRLWKVLLL